MRGGVTSHKSSQHSLLLSSHLHQDTRNSTQTHALATESGRNGSVQLKIDPGAKRGTPTPLHPLGPYGDPLPLPKVPWSPYSRAGCTKGWLGA